MALLSGSRSIDELDPADGLAAVVALRRLADTLEATHVERALRAGWRWAEVAEALGVTRQAVHKKHARRLKVGIETRRAADV
jgi:transcriptional regulator with GAF, ATPase, and Fis domain